MGKYSFKALKNNKPKRAAESRKTINCYNCGNGITRFIAKYKVSCPAKNAECNKCGKTRHFVNVCKSTKKVNKVYNIEGSKESEVETDNTSYHVNIFCVKASSTKPVLQSHLNSKQDFKVQVVVHNRLQPVITHTGARISVYMWNCTSKELGSPWKDMSIKEENQTLQQPTTPSLW